VGGGGWQIDCSPRLFRSRQAPPPADSQELAGAGGRARGGALQASSGPEASSSEGHVADDDRDDEGTDEREDSPRGGAWLATLSGPEDTPGACHGSSSAS